MSAYSNGASRAPSRRAHGAGQLPLYLDVLGVQYNLRHVPLGPDDPTVVVELSLPDGTRHVAACCLGWHECDCPVYLDSDDKGECHHLRALVREGVFPAPRREWAAWMTEPMTAAEYAGAKGGHR